MQRLGDLRFVDGAHVAQLLGNNQIRPDLSEQVGLHTIQAVAMRRKFMDCIVYLGGRKRMLENRLQHHGLFAGLRRIVALERDAGDGVSQSECIKYFGGCGKK